MNTPKRSSNRRALPGYGPANGNLYLVDLTNDARCVSVHREKGLAEITVGCQECSAGPDGSNGDLLATSFDISALPLFNDRLPAGQAGVWVVENRGASEAVENAVSRDVAGKRQEEEG